MSWLRTLRAVFGSGVPEEFEGLIPADEDVLATATTRTGGHLVVTTLGLWVPESAGRRIGWHLVSKATWSEGVLTVTEATEVEELGGAAVLLADRAPVRWPLTRPGRVPQLVQRKVESSIRARHHKELARGAAWFVLRQVPGRDGVVLQARPEGDADRETVAAMAAEAAAEMTPPEQ